ncbi:MAG: rod shape-determining protein MreC [Thalassobaculaceae bacterium]
MARGPLLFARVVRPVRSLWQRFAFATLIGMALSLMVADQSDIKVFKQIKMSAIHSLGTLLELGVETSTAARETFETLAELGKFKGELERLRLENNELKKWRYAAEALNSQNMALRDLHSFVPLPTIKSITGRIISYSGGAFTRSILINVGSKNGARLGQAVMSSFALVGVLVEVADEYSRVLLVTDLNSQIPVKIQNNGISGILIGDNSPLAKLFFLPQESVLAEGQIVTTSGRGGVLPPDLPIGLVKKTEGLKLVVEPFNDRVQSGYVRVLNYKFSGTILVN